MFRTGRSAGKVVIVKQVITIDEMQAEIETLRNAVVRLAIFVNGDPCWCKCEGGKHSKVCRDILKLKLWPRPSGSKAASRDHLPWKIIRKGR